MAALLHAADDRPPSADRVPTLTEVVELHLPVPAEDVDEPLAADPMAAGAEPAMTAAASDVEEAVVDLALNAPSPQLPPAAQPEPPPQLMPSVAAMPVPAIAAVDPDALVLAVLHELSPRVDLMLEARLREALAPALARAVDGLIRDARQEVAATLRELVHEAVARALRQRGH